MTVLRLANVNPRGPVFPAPVRLRADGWDGCRLVSVPEVEPYSWACRALGLAVMADITDASKGNILRSATHAQIGNEPDGDGVASDHKTPTEYRAFVLETAPRVRALLPGVPVIGAGLSTGDNGPAYLDACGPLPLDAIAVHVYGRSPGPGHWGPFGDVGELLSKYRRFGKPIYVTEYGAQAHQIGEEEQARYLAAMMRRLRDLDVPAALFSWHSFSGAEFWSGGLCREDGSERPAMAAVMEVLSMPEFKLGFKDLADKLGEPVVGKPVEDEHYFPDGSTSLQATTKGLMIYSKPGNQAIFLPAALPNS